jgi:Tfp pilus assembly protein FimT
MKSIVRMVLAAAAPRKKITFMGLTPTELAVILAIIAVIAAIVLPVFA